MLRRDFLKTSMGIIAGLLGVPKLSGREAWKQASAGKCVNLYAHGVDRSLVFHAVGHGPKTFSLRRDWLMEVARLSLAMNGRLVLLDHERRPIVMTHCGSQFMTNWIPAPLETPIANHFLLEVAPADKSPWAIAAVIMDFEGRTARIDRALGQRAMERVATDADDWDE